VQCPFIKELLGGCMLIIGEGHATLRAGLLQALLWGKEPRKQPLAFAAAWAVTVSKFPAVSAGHSVLGWKLRVPGRCNARHVLDLGFIVDFIQNVHGIPVQEVNLGVDTQILSLSEGQPRQIGDHYLGHAWNLQQRSAPVSRPRCCMWCPTALCVKFGDFQGCDGLGPHALPAAELGKHVKE
jgi:hypothetical protein